ncbi:ABC transporter permease [Paractinoplanes deccanensis]|uniref:ABC transporter permease n=1 Tax=Paractinoplanes deccanensis TaxID=113561 RepID=A0ABQ3YLJ2_9ACTN|nr:ABC transporter permease [Actinoplanes deccanensis]GID80868.1 ABC transporter permease [Actinoplanes deccanensis]
MTAVAERPVSAVPARRWRFRGVAWTVVTLAAGLAVWTAVAWWYGSALVASPAETLRAGIDLAKDGSLGESVLASTRRILLGWALGVVVGGPIGILMGRVPAIRRLLDPYIEFFRFIPPIAFVTLAIVWFGIGEMSKIVLIFYTSVFIVTINTIAGVLAIEESKLRAAASLGANRWQLLHAVVLPAAIPYIVTGARLAMGNSFLTIVSAEIVAADTGIGAMIWQSRNYGRIDWIFVGIIALGLLGFVCDRLIRIGAGRLLRRYGVKV